MIFRIPEEWLNLGLIEGELFPCPGLGFLPKPEEKRSKAQMADPIQILNHLYEVLFYIIYLYRLWSKNNNT